MQDQNVALIRKLYDAFAKGDIQTIINHVADDVEWISEGPAVVPWYGKKKGRAGVQEFFHGLASTQENMKLTIDDFVAQDDRVATFGRFKSKTKATGREIDTPIAHFFRIRDGKVVKFLNFGDTAQAEAAFGGASAAGGR